MAAHTFDSIYRLAKKGEFSPVYYLTGEADVLKDELTDIIVDGAVPPAARDFNVDVRSAGDVDGEALHALIETPPMLSDRRAVVLKNLEQWRANSKVWQVLYSYLKSPSPSTVLVLTHGAGEKIDRTVASAATLVEVSTLGNERLSRWIKNRAARAELTLEPDAADHLIQAVGGDMAHLSMEIEKLAAAIPPGRPATTADVAALVGIRSGETLADWVEAVINRDAPKAGRLVEQVLAQAGVNGVRMLTALGSALIGIRIARAGLDEGSAPGRVESDLFRSIQNARLQVGWKSESARWTKVAQHWTAHDLDRAIHTVYDADKIFKNTTTSDEAGLILSVVLTVAAQRSAA